MKKLMFIMAGVILAFAITSCEKGKVNPTDMPLGDTGAIKGKKVEMPTIPQPNDLDSRAFWIPSADGKDRGGNRTCEDVIAAFPEHFSAEDFSDCGGKIDIADDYVGLVGDIAKINEDGTIEFDVGVDRNCFVKAVIVKGSNNANVYIYPDGVTSDVGLLPPPFDPDADVIRYPWVSNITFCCFCDGEYKRYAVKVKLDGSTLWAASNGSFYPYETGGSYCDYLGFGNYPDEAMDLILEYTDTDIGDVSVDTDGNVSISVDAGYSFDEAFLFVGNMLDMGAFNQCPDMTINPPWSYKLGPSDNTVIQTVIFEKDTDF